MNKPKVNSLRRSFDNCMNSKWLQSQTTAEPPNELDAETWPESGRFDDWFIIVHSYFYKALHSNRIGELSLCKTKMLEKTLT